MAKAEMLASAARSCNIRVSISQCRMDGRVQNNQPFLLSPWLAEFTNPSTEAAFRAVERPRTLRELRRSLTVASFLILMFGVTDYTTLGVTTAFYWLLAMRLVVGLGTLAFARSLSHYPRLVQRQLPLNLLIGIICTMIIAIVPLRPDTVGTQHTALIVVSILFYLYIPNRLIWQLAANLYLATGFMLASAVYAPELGAVRLGAMALLLVMVNVAGFMTSQSLNRLRREQFAAMAEQRETNLQLHDEVERSRVMQHQLRHHAQTDDLTGLCNRRHFMELAEKAHQQCREQNQPMAVCMLDLDHFKTINDQLGHAAGDLVLQRVANACLEALRNGDLMGRFGGEEFVVALPGADIAEARKIAERLRRCVETLPIREHDLNLSVTIGVAAVAAHEDSLEPALIRADLALYRGKAVGRDTVVVDAGGAGAEAAR